MLPLVQATLFSPLPDSRHRKSASHAAAISFPQQFPGIYEVVTSQWPVWGVSASAPQYVVVLYLTRTRAGGTFIFTPGFGEAPDSLATPLDKDVNPLSRPTSA
jgi:hypothetical protein